jgi:hypothetical protein
MNLNFAQNTAQQQQPQPRAAAPATPSANLTCPDACGDIKQLQQDVADLKNVAASLTTAVKQLSVVVSDKNNNLKIPAAPSR